MGLQLVTCLAFKYLLVLVYVLVWIISRPSSLVVDILLMMSLYLYLSQGLSLSVDACSKNPARRKTSPLYVLLSFSLFKFYLCKNVISFLLRGVAFPRLLRGTPTLIQSVYAYYSYFNNIICLVGHVLDGW